MMFVACRLYQSSLWRVHLLLFWLKRYTPIRYPTVTLQHCVGHREAAEGVNMAIWRNHSIGEMLTSILELIMKSYIIASLRYYANEINN